MKALESARGGMEDDSELPGDDRPDYKYVSIVDVNPPSPPYYDAATECGPFAADDTEARVCSSLIEIVADGQDEAIERECDRPISFTELKPVTSSLCENGVPPREGVVSLSEESQSLEERLVRAVKDTLGSEVDGSLREKVEQVVREKLKRQRSGSSDYWNQEDNDDHCIVDFLDKINDHVCNQPVEFKLKSIRCEVAKCFKCFEAMPVDHTAVPHKLQSVFCIYIF